MKPDMIGYEEALSRVESALVNGYSPSFYTVAGGLRALAVQAATVDMSEQLFLKMAKVALASARGRELSNTRFLQQCGLPTEPPREEDDGA